MRWTTIEPEEHLVPRILRGLPLKTDKRFCFVVYEDNEQEEEGDTYIHIFTKEPWPHCETRWFYFHGRIAGDSSPSTTAIFKKHRIAPEWWLILTEPWSSYGAIPTFTQILFEPWSAYPSPPGFTQVLSEPWSEYSPPLSWEQILGEEWSE